MRRSFKKTLPVILNCTFTGTGFAILLMPVECLSVGWRIAVAVAWLCSFLLTAYTVWQAAITSVSAADLSDIKTD